MKHDTKVQLFQHHDSADAEVKRAINNSFVTQFVVEWKKGRKSPTFVEDQRRALEEFDQKAHRRTADMAGTLNEARQKTNPAAATAPAVTSHPATENPATLNPAIPHPATSNPATSNPAPTQAPSNPAPIHPAPTHPATTSNDPSTTAPSKMRSVVRVKRKQMADAMDVDDSDDGSDYRPSALAPSSEQSRKKDKGKQRATPFPQPATTSPNVPEQVREHRWKNRRHAEATGEIHETPCEHCDKRGVACEKEVGGGACVLCWKGKVKCKYSAVRNVRPRQRRTGVKRAKSEIPVEKRRAKKSTPYVNVTSDEDSEEIAVPPSGATVPAPSGAPAPAPSGAPAPAPSRRAAPSRVPAPIQAPAPTVGQDSEDGQ
jgi:hypothetical protein